MYEKCVNFGTSLSHVFMLSTITLMNLLILLNYINMKNNYILDVGPLYVE